MRLKAAKRLSVLMIVTLFIVGCTPRNQGETQGGAQQEVVEPAIKVFASFYPYYDFAQKVGGERVDLQVVVPAGVEPHSFEPSARLIAQLQEADVFIYNGLEMEPWIDGVLEILKDQEIRIVNASEGLKLLSFEEEDHHHDEGDDHDHDHDEDAHHGEDEHHDDDHGHGEYDPHIWLDPMNAMQIAERIKNTFVEVDPEYSQTYEENYENFKAQLEKLDQDFKQGLEEAKDRKIIVSHSAFGYLAHRYDIEQISVAGVSPHEEPSPRRLAELTNIAREYNINYIFFEVLANPKTADILAKEANLEVLTLYNLEGLSQEQKSQGEDYISLMYKNLENLRKALVR